MKYVVATVAEIPPGERKIVDVGGRSVGVFNVGGEFFAVLNRCPHQGGPLCQGNTHGFLRSAGVGEYRYSPAAKIVHFTIGGPYFPAYRDCDYGAEWFAERDSMLQVEGTKKGD